MEEYKTLRAPASDEFTEKRSRFIGYAQPVSTQVEAAAFIERIKKQHHDATHNVFAYLLREGQLERYSDDGEPQGTAGIPVLDVLRKQGVTNCAVVVTRYFGGILLGAGRAGAGVFPRCGNCARQSGDRYHGALCNFRHCLRLQLLWQACRLHPGMGRDCGGHAVRRGGYRAGAYPRHAGRFILRKADGCEQRPLSGCANRRMLCGRRLI